MNLPIKKLFWLKSALVGFLISIIFFWVKLMLTTSDVAPPICNYDGDWEIVGMPCSATEFIVQNYIEEIITVTIVFAILGWLYSKIFTRGGSAVGGKNRRNSVLPKP